MPLLTGIVGLTPCKSPVVQRCGSELGESRHCEWVGKEVMWAVRVKTVQGA